MADIAVWSNSTQRLRVNVVNSAADVIEKTQRGHACPVALNRSSST
ncbi:MAG TPA: hypothetical protein VFC19_05170 [Candidatus Limnocylindrales bacterium]|nr:hypothetical protein [Candidatus Limnocylindrales bacterium]